MSLNKIMKNHFLDRKDRTVDFVARRITDRTQQKIHDEFLKELEEIFGKPDDDFLEELKTLGDTHRAE